MSIFGAVGNFFSGSDKVKGAKNAGNQAAKFLNESDAKTVYAPGGAKAFGAQQGLLGVGGDPEASQAAFQNYLGSTGYRTTLQGGNDAITSSMAAGLGNKSGAADKARLRFGTGLGAQYFDNYFSKLDGMASRGQRADEFVSGGLAKVKAQQYSDMGQARADRTDAVFEGIGDAAAAAMGAPPGSTGAGKGGKGSKSAGGSGGNPWSNIWFG